MTSTSMEIERKYEAPPDFTLPDLTGLPDAIGPGETAEFELDATYYDTDDLRLTRNQLTLRRRGGGHDAGWHLKRPAGVGRSETKAADADDLPADLAAQVRVIVREAELRPLVRLRTMRRETPLLDPEGNVLALIADDRVDSELIGAGQDAWHELEVELVSGSPDLLDAVEVMLVEAGARRSDLPSKLVRALGDRAPQPLAQPAGGSRAGRTLMAYVREQRDQIRQTDPAVRLADADGVHDMRVAIRRLRSTLRTFAATLGDADALRDELRWIARLLGAVRDGDVLANGLIHDVSQAAPDMVPSIVTRRIRRRLTLDIERARDELNEALDSPRYFRLLDDLDRYADRPAPNVNATALRKGARNRLAKADRGIEAAMHVGLVAPSKERDLALHEARKAYKKARYAVEAIAPDDAKKAARLIKRLRDLQDLLGEHQDAVVAATLLRQLGQEAHEAGESEFGFGVLCEQQTERAADRRREIPTAYRHAAKRKARAWLE